MEAAEAATLAQLEEQEKRFVQGFGQMDAIFFCHFFLSCIKHTSHLALQAGRPLKVQSKSWKRPDPKTFCWHFLSRDLTS